MSETTYMAEVVYVAHRHGWTREALQRVPPTVFADWCREQGMDRIGDWLEHRPWAGKLLRDYCRSWRSFAEALDAGSDSYWLRNDRPVVTASR